MLIDDIDLKAPMRMLSLREAARCMRKAHECVRSPLEAGRMCEGFRQDAHGHRACHNITMMDRSGMWCCIQVKTGNSAFHGPSRLWE